MRKSKAKSKDITFYNDITFHSHSSPCSFHNKIDLFMTQS